MQTIIKRLQKIFLKLKNIQNYILYLIRWSDWKDVRIPFVFISILYFHYTDQILGTGLPAYGRFFSLFLFSVFYYGFLFLVNDIFDFNQDVLSKHKDGKRSKKIMILGSILLLVSGISMAMVGWNMVSMRSILILSIGYALAYFYSAPPLRFKEKGWWGIVVGAIVLRPMSILMILAGLTSIDRLYEIIIFVFWLEIFGIRTMLFHQIDDYYNDRQARVRTFVTQHGKQLAHKLIVSIFLPVEMITFFAVIIMMTIHIPTLVCLVAVYGVYQIWIGRWRKWTWKDVSHYRPLFGSVVFFLLPVYLALLVTIKYSLWFIPFFVLYWQRHFAMELFQRFSDKMQ